MVRPVETLTMGTLLEEGVAELVPVSGGGKTALLAEGVKLRVGPGGPAELHARTLLPDEDQTCVLVDPTLQAHEWAPVWEGRAA